MTAIQAEAHHRRQALRQLQRFREQPQRRRPRSQHHQLQHQRLHRRGLLFLSHLWQIPALLIHTLMRPRLDQT